MLLFVDIRIKTMGTKMAPTYATPVLGYLEHILYEQLLNSYGQEFASYVRQSWKRFLDDKSDLVQCFVYFSTKMLLQKFLNRAEYLYKDLQHQN
jgi:hypothetical protein